MNSGLSIVKLTPEDLGAAFGNAPSVYDTPAFVALNAAKAEAVEAYALADGAGRPVVGQIYGLRDGCLCAPFSAPFSLPWGDASQAAGLYRELIATTGHGLHLAWAPECYGVEAPSAAEAGLTVEAVEVNFHYPMERFADYRAHLSRSARYNLNYAMRHEFEFCRTDDVARAYRIIRLNREAMGYPLAMSLEQMEATVKVVPADFFVLSLGGEDVAAAMAYRVMPGAVQLIYWGDLPQARASKAMNMLAYRVVEWYAANVPDLRLFDVGPASTGGVRNEGLCEFKRSLGCIETEKKILGVRR